MLQRQRCVHRSGGRLHGGAAAVQLRYKLDNALGEGRLQPDQLGVAAPQPGRVDPDDVLEAAHRKIETLPLGAGARPVRRLRPLHEGEIMQRLQELLDGGHS
ncbi:hypothetical protein QFZ33_001142 [Arthrobacter globiformis]|nr:hypothetical protein [Arthrobacter globiformis]